MPKSYKYSIIHNGVTTVLTTDPKGWQEESIGFTRSDDHGLNVEYTIPLSFAKEGYRKLKAVFDSGGMFATAQLKIEKRNNSWGFDNFYLYKLDFKTYKDNLYSIEINGLEDGLLSKFNACADTEYEIPLASEKRFLSYTGVSKVQSNILQAGVGQLTANHVGVSYFFPIKGSRAVRSYAPEFKFTDADGNPFTTMMFQCLSSHTVSVKISLAHIIKSSSILSPPAGQMALIQHDADWATVSVVTNLYNNSEGSDWNITTRWDEFHYMLDLTISFEAGWYYSWCYISSVDTGNAELINTDYDYNNGRNSYMDINYVTVSEFTGSKLHVFTHDWLINALLAKIDPTAVLSYGLEAEHYLPVLAAPSCIRNLGNLAFDGTVTVSLRNVLKSLNCFYGIGIDVTGNVMSIRRMSEMYKQESAGRLVAKNLVLTFSEKHNFNKIKVGSKATNLVTNGYYAFNCENNFTVQNSLVDSSLDLTCPFKTDMYSIDKIVLDAASATSTTTDTTTENKGDIVCFAIAIPSGSGDYSLIRSSASFISGFKGDTATAYNLPLSPKRILNTHKKYLGVSNFRNGLPIIYASTDINADTVSRLSWESENVTEKAEIVTVDADVPFLPLTITFDTAERYSTLVGFQSDKYKYYEVLDERTGKIYTGWPNKITFGIAKDQSQNWELQAYEV